MTNPLPIRLKAARKAKDLTQQQLGMRLGMEQSTASARMNQYEKGKHAPDYQTMQRIAQELGYPVAYFYCDDELLAELICMMAKLSEEKQRELLRQLSIPKHAGSRDSE
ncbi:helix-turn-helix domain-containing protein [Aeromonas salmonicida]|uniref:helix-turn-helix domain-containing protein n=1 Tax=Aeromonas salmonicida TaxID=645 RepID=UPI000F78CDB6|nr:helix-turn-helix transcriptional regulator [Aeromonas salmonicida]RSM25001.1 XRE family transcriptional regulator [Aeromonas salmonicida]